MNLNYGSSIGTSLNGGSIGLRGENNIAITREMVAGGTVGLGGSTAYQQQQYASAGSFGVSGGAASS